MAIEVFEGKGRARAKEAQNVEHLRAHLVGGRSIRSGTQLRVGGAFRALRTVAYVISISRLSAQRCFTLGRAQATCEGSSKTCSISQPGTLKWPSMIVFRRGECLRVFVRTACLRTEADEDARLAVIASRNKGVTRSYWHPTTFKTLITVRCTHYTMSSSSRPDEHGQITYVRYGTVQPLTRHGRWWILSSATPYVRATRI